MPIKRRKFTREFKLQVVSEVESKIKTRAQVTREYQLSEGLIHKWLSEYRRDPQTAFRGSGLNVSPLEAKISQLEWALGRKTMENEVLKKTLQNLGSQRR